MVDVAEKLEGGGESDSPNPHCIAKSGKRDSKLTQLKPNAS